MIYGYNQFLNFQVDVHSPFEISSSDSSNIALHKSDEIIASYKVLETV